MENKCLSWWENNKLAETRLEKSPISVVTNTQCLCATSITVSKVITILLQQQCFCW
jgi:hypothetical protein